MRFTTTTLSSFLALLLLLSLSVEAPSAPAPDEIETAKAKLAALKKKLPDVLNECLDNGTLWPRKFKGKVGTLRMIGRDEAKLTIRLDAIPVDNVPDPPAGVARRVVQNPNEVVFIYLKYFDGMWTTYREGPVSIVVLNKGVSNLMAAIDDLAEQQEAGK